MSLFESIGSRIGLGLDQVTSLFYEEVEVTRYVTLPVPPGGFLIPDPDNLDSSDHHFLDITAPGVLDSAPSVIFFRTAHTGFGQLTPAGRPLPSG